MKYLLALLFIGSSFLLGLPTWAGDKATTEEAKAMAIKAAAYLKANGPEKSFAEFSAKDGPWHDRDLYVTVLDSSGVMRAHGTNPGLIGKSLIDLKDVDGKAFNREMLAVTDTGWVNFKWQNPLTKAVEQKTAFEVRVGEYIVGVGAYGN
jgi:signal transduction histidine kinase